PYYEDITVDYEPGTSREVKMPDGSTLVLKKLDADYEPNSRERALNVLQQAVPERKLVTGLFYVDPEGKPFEEEMEMAEAPLATLPLEQVRPPREVLADIMRSFQVGNVP